MARLLGLLKSSEQRLVVTKGSDYSDVAKWLKPTKGAALLITYMAGPYPNTEQNAAIREWLTAGGRWVALHASNAVFTKGAYGSVDFNETLGTAFVGHPPLHTFPVTVADTSHPITKGLPVTFEAFDELYINDLHAAVREEELSPLLTAFNKHDDQEHVIAYTREVGQGTVAYIGLGHCHDQWEPNREVDGACVGPWDSEAFTTLLSNSISWGVAIASPPATEPTPRL